MKTTEFRDILAYFQIKQLDFATKMAQSKFTVYRKVWQNGKVPFIWKHTLIEMLKEKNILMSFEELEVFHTKIVEGGFRYQKRGIDTTHWI